MDSNKLFFKSKEHVKFINRILRPVVNYLLLFILFFLIMGTVSEIGFTEHSRVLIRFIVKNTQLLFTLVGILYLIRSLVFIGFRNYTIELGVFISAFLFILLEITLNIDRHIYWLNTYHFYSILAIGFFIFEISRFDIKKVSWILNPAQLFMISFGFIIMLGALLLMMPNATTLPISFVDALFTSTSAVCVTGLATIDTASGFTILGKSIILILIQIGGIGIMSFTSFFGIFFKGGTSSFSERFVLSDFLSEDNISQIAKTVLKVVLITLIIEGIGVILIFSSLDNTLFPSVQNRLHISVFHSVSAFCNAGFSTLEMGLYNPGTRHNIFLLYSISFLIIFGGIGFPILLNIYTYIKVKFHNLTNRLFYSKRPIVIPKLININSKLVLGTTIILLVIGTVIFYIFEASNSLNGMSISEKIAQSFFGSVTPRTAGYNSIDYSRLSVSAVVLTIFLMWVGASPVSTGGGIKTSTFAIALLNTLRIARMKRHIEFNKREIHERSVNRAFAIIILSIIILGCSSLIMQLFEPGKSALSILFECVSAFSTVGLSLGITTNLKDASKILLILLMFVGRMGILTLLFAIFQHAKSAVYRYPKEYIVIN
jgi:trk system potassium uptake protein TrkH